jgi:hypothetical protein
MPLLRTGRARRGRETAGQAIMEFALALPVFAILILGIIEGARFAFYSAMINDAARAGARYTIIHGSGAADGCPSGPPAPGTAACDVDGTNVEQAVRDAAFDLVDSGNLTFGWSGDSRFPLYLAPDGVTEVSTNARGTRISVRLIYAYDPVLSFLPPISIEAESNLVVNN